MIWAVAALAGAALGSHERAPLLPPAGLLALIGAAAGVVGVAVACHRGRAKTAAAALGVLLVGVTLANLRVAELQTGPLLELATVGGAVEVDAVVVGEPRTSDDGWWWLVRVTRVGQQATRERALVRGSQPPAVGSHWRGEVTARPLGDGGFDAYLRRQHTVIRIDPRTWSPTAPPGVLLRSAELVRGRVRAAATRGLPPDEAGLAAGLVTGDTRLLDDEVAAAMRDTGLSHLTAVSGSNVAVVLVGVAMLTAAAGLGARGRRWLTILAVTWFCVLTRFEPSVLRAAVMVAMVVLAAWRGVGSAPLHALAGAVLLLVLVDPFLAGSLGLLLSAAATAGVLVVAPRLRERLVPAARENGPRPRGRLGRAIARLGPRTADLAAVTLGAQIAVAPVLMVSQGQVPLSSVPANLLAVPAAAIASMVAVAGSLIAQVSPVVAAPVMTLARPPLAMIIAVASGLRLRGGVISRQRPLTVLAAILIVGWLLARPGTRSAGRAATAGAAAVLLAVIPSLAARLPARELTVTAIDVGQGDAVLVRAPGATVLVDGGPDGRAAAWLRGAGVRGLDLVVISHPHADHVDGLPEVVAQSRLGTLWYRPVPGDLDAVERVLELTGERGTPVIAPVAGQRASVGELSIEVLGPPSGRPYRFADSEPNETSLVLRACWRGRCVLLTGDAEQAAQDDLLASPQHLRAGVLKVAHHGSKTSSSAFLTAPSAAVALISLGEDNRYGHPDPGTIGTLTTAGTRILRTDVAGTITVAVPATTPEAARAADPRLTPLAAGLASRHDRFRHPRHRRRRPPAPASNREGARRAPSRASRPAGRDLRRQRGPPATRDADLVAVRWHHRGRGAQRRDGVG